MRLDLHALKTLPKLAWVAAIRKNEERVHVLHGPWVETREDRFFEGAWDGPFRTGAFNDAVTFLGSGGRLAGDRIIFAGSTHKLDRIQSVLAGETLYVSNSLVLLLTRAGEELDLAHANYFFDYLRYFRAGIRTKIKPIRLRSGNQAHLHDCCNLLVDGNLTIQRVEKPAGRPPTCYRDYADYLEKTAQLVSANATDSARKQIFRPIAAISRGYDSVAVAALASRANCTRAVTFRHSGQNGIEDSGAQIAKHLRMEFTEYDRGDYLKVRGFPEAEFYPYARLSAKALVMFEDQLAGSLFFNGQAGEDYWDKNWNTALPLLQEHTAQTMSGSNLAEFRLRAGFIYFPLACCGAVHAPALARIGRSPAMRDWSIGGQYDRPIPRRLAEERGVPRNLFGQIKAGGGPEVGEFGLGPASDADFRQFYDDFIRQKLPAGKRRAPSGFRRWLQLIRPLRDFLNWTPWIARLFSRYISERLDPRRGSMALYTFHWGFYRVKERYEKSLKNCSDENDVFH